MSFVALGWAIKQTAGSSSAKALLFALADCHNGETGDCYPGLDYLATHAEMHRATVIRTLAILEERGLIKVESRGGDGSGRKSNNYVLNIAGQADLFSAQNALDQPVDNSDDEEGKVASCDQQSRNLRLRGKVASCDGLSRNLSRQSRTVRPEPVINQEGNHTQGKPESWAVNFEAVDNLNLVEWAHWLRHRLLNGFRQYRSDAGARAIAHLTHEQQKRCIQAAIVGNWKSLHPANQENDRDLRNGQNRNRESFDDTQQALRKAAGLD